MRAREYLRAQRQHAPFWINTVVLCELIWALTASYYPMSREGGAVIDYRDWGVPLGRRFRALKLWFVIRSCGALRLRAMLRDHIAWTAELAGWIGAEPDFELTSPPSLALLSFRYRPPGLEDAEPLDRLNERLLQALNDGGRVYLTQNRLRGRYVIRFTIGQLCTTRDHVRRAGDLIRETARTLGQ